MTQLKRSAQGVFRVTIMYMMVFYLVGYTDSFTVGRERGLIELCISYHELVYLEYLSHLIL